MDDLFDELRNEIAEEYNVNENKSENELRSDLKSKIKHKRKLKEKQPIIMLSSDSENDKERLVNINESFENMSSNLGPSVRVIIYDS